MFVGTVNPNVDSTTGMCPVLRPETISFIGTGNMGLPLIRKLLDGGYKLRLYDKFNNNYELLEHPNAIFCASPKAASQGVETVITCLPLPVDVYENMMGGMGALAGMQPGSTWIDTSTTDYHNTLRIAEAARRGGISSLEAPVSNLSHMGVDFANVCFYVGGGQTAYEANRKVIETMGRKSFYVGEIGMGQTVKLFTNLLFYTALPVWGDALIIAKSHGVPLKWLWNRARKSNCGCFVVDQLTPFMLDGSYDSSCTLEIAVKDTELVCDLGIELDVPMPVGQVIRDRYAEAGRSFDHQENHVIVVQLSELANAVSVQINGFTAPSPYGRNKSYIRSSEMVFDHYGRSKPFLHESFYHDDRVAGPEDQQIADILIDFLALVNFRILKETRKLAYEKGLSNQLITEVVRWSCGPSWVGDHEETFQPKFDSVDEVMRLAGSLKLPTIQKIADITGSPVSGAWEHTVQPAAEAGV